VLDYGCGPGYLLGPLVAAGCEVWGGDFSADVVGGAWRDLNDQPNFHGVSTIAELIGREQFDVVTVLEVIEHLDDTALNETLDNIGKLLRSGGHLIVTTPNDERLEEGTVYSPIANVTFHRWQHMRSWSAESLGALLRDRGLSVETKQVNFRDQYEHRSLRSTVQGCRYH